MARIILKSRYLRAGSKQHSEHLIQYIAKREGVQKIDDTWKHQPATKEQRKLIGELLRDFPEVKDSFEYADYLAKSNKGTASELISRAIDDNVDLIGKRENYVSYVPEYSFDFRALTITLIIFVFTYELVMYLYSRSIKRLSVKSIMLE